MYAGLRPLLAGESDATSKLSREHTVAHPVPGLVVVAGGKYTTYRVMAKDAVDEAVHGLDQRVADCVTEDVPLVGAEGYQALWNARARIAARTGLHVVRVEHLLNRYGSLTEELLDLIAGRPRPWASRCRPPTTTCGPRSSTPPRTRAPGTWTTS